MVTFRPHKPESRFESGDRNKICPFGGMVDTPVLEAGASKA